MPIAPRTLLASSTLALVLAAAAGAQAETILDFHGQIDGRGFVGASFALLDAPVGEPQAPAARAQAASLAGSTIAALPNGALVIDADSGDLVRTDSRGKPTARVAIGHDAAQLVYDSAKKRAYVSDRRNDHIVVVEVGDDLRAVDSIRTRAEPFGLALSPDRKTLLVTTVADRSLTAYSTTSASEQWSVEIGPEPRGVAIAPDGREALVTMLTTGAVARVDLAYAASAPRVSYVSLDVAAAAVPARVNFVQSQGLRVSKKGVASRPQQRVEPINLDKGKSFARNAFAAIYVGHDIGVVPHQLSTPHIGGGELAQENRGTYGGGGGVTPPVSHRLAFLSGEGTDQRTAMAQTSVHQPRAMAYDGRSDTLYVAGYGSDDVLAIANVSQASVKSTWQLQIASATSASTCGPNGLAVADDGDVWVYCSLTRRTVRLEGDPASSNAPKLDAHGGELSPSRLGVQAQLGRDLFRRGLNSRMSSGGMMACESCHAEGRSDGLSWRIEGHNLQTPLLSGRVVGTAPFRWDGREAKLESSMTDTIRRLGGTGLKAKEVKAVAAYLSSLEAPRTPTPANTHAVARGEKLFASDATGCVSCHSGTMYTDRKMHELSADLAKVDTPSLVGLAQSAPYYHDGSARTLRSLLMGNGSIHGMGRISKLTEPQMDDLVAYLNSL